VVTGSETPPTALLVGWLRSKLGIPVELKKSGRDIQEVRIALSSDGSGPPELVISRRDDRSAVIKRADQAERVMPIALRDLGDLLAEDVRRLDSDEVYAEALSAWTGIKGLSSRSNKREHIWFDPATGHEEKPAKPAAKAGAKAAAAATTEDAAPAKPAEPAPEAARK
jgi:glucose-6-phosphate dehydrogenase assembly protein OpcA